MTDAVYTVALSWSENPRSGTHVLCLGGMEVARVGLRFKTVFADTWMARLGPTSPDVGLSAISNFDTMEAACRWAEDQVRRVVKASWPEGRSI